MIDRSTRETVPFGVVTDDPARRTWLKNACDLLTRRIGAIVYPQVARSYVELADAMVAGTVKLAWTPPLIAADLVERGTAIVVAISRRDNYAQYRAVIFARRDSGIRSVQDLAGKHIAWVDATSASGYVVPRAWLRDNGFIPDNFFGRQSFLGTHGAVARAVLRGEADAGATFALFSAGLRSTVSAGWTEIDPMSAHEVEMVLNAGTVPADCISLAARVTAETRARIEETLLSLKDDDLSVFRKALGSEGYDRCPRDHAHALRRLRSEAARAARPTIPSIHPGIRRV